MRILSAPLLLLAFAVVALTGVHAGGKDDKVTLKGTITCPSATWARNRPA